MKYFRTLYFESDVEFAIKLDKKNVLYGNNNYAYLSSVRNP